ncbi:hypothetical protein LCL85_00375 [Vibrio alginolyticus]|nr:hypothetical protein [Vibrio alginolyticus]
MIESLKAWLYTPDGLFYTIFGGLYLLCFLGLGIALLARYYTKKEVREKKEAEKEKLESRTFWR